MNYYPVETRSPLAVLRTTNKRPAANQIHMLEQLDQFDVRAIMAGPDRVGVSTGELKTGEGIYQTVGKVAIGANESADVLRIIRRLRLADRGLENLVPHLNPDNAFMRTVDKLETANVYGELTIPSRLLIANNFTLTQSKAILADAGEEWGEIVVKPRTGSKGENIFIGEAEQLEQELDGLGKLEGQPNFIVQPFLDSRNAYKPYLPNELQNRPTSLRVIGGVTHLPGMAPVAEIFTAFYRYAPNGQEKYHDAEDQNYYLQRASESIENSHPELGSCFDLVKQALLKGAATEMPTSHGIKTQICSTDLLILPQDAPYGFTPDTGDFAYKPIIMEQNSGTSRFDAGKHDPTRDAWHIGEARMLASLAHKEMIRGI